jgi:membrane associated rhomboid family serine protease
MIPVRDVIPSRTRPWVVFALMGGHAAVFACQCLLGADARDAFQHTWGLIAPAFTWSSAVTSMFLHAGWLDVTTNLAALWIFGENVERRLGHAGFLAFYLAGGVLAALVTSAAAPHNWVPFANASGGIAVVIGAYLVLFPASRVLVLTWLITRVDLIEIPALVAAAVWLMLHVIDSLARMTPTSAIGIPLVSIAAGTVWGLSARLIARRERW